MVRQRILWPGTSSLTYAKRRKWIIGFEGLCGTIWLPGTPGPQKHKAWMDIRAQCTHPNVTRIQWGGSQLYFWSDSGISAVVCFGGWGKPKGGPAAKASYCDQPRVPMYCWHRLLQQKVLNDPEMYWFLVCLPWTLRKWNSCLPFQESWKIPLM